jgi:hypothetical protein
MSDEFRDALVTLQRPLRLRPANFITGTVGLTGYSTLYASRALSLFVA